MWGCIKVFWFVFGLVGFLRLWVNVLFIICMVVVEWGWWFFIFKHNFIKLFSIYKVSKN